MTERLIGQVTDEGIRLLVDRFYGKIRSDARLGPIFEGAIGDEARWETHLATMRDFWSGVMLSSGRYKGNPLRAHLPLDAVRPEDFERWLGLFEETCRELFTAPVADAFREKAGRIAQSFQYAMFYRPDIGWMRGRVAS